MLQFMVNKSHLNKNFQLYSEKRFILSISLTMLFSYFQISFFNSYVVIYLETDLLTSIIVITFIVSLRNIIQLFLRVPLGELSQVIGRKPLILLGNLCFSIALLFSFIANDWILILFAILILGFGMSSFWPATFSYIGDVSDERYGENNGKMFQGMDIGLIFSSVLAVLLLDFFKINLKEIFGIFFLIGFVFLIVNYKILPETLNVAKKLKIYEIITFLIRSIIKMLPNILKMTKKPILRRVYFLQFIISLTEFTVTIFFPVLVFSKGFSKSDVGIIILLGTVLLILFKPFLGKLSDKFGFERPILFFLAVSCITIVSMTLTNDFILLILLNAIVTGSLLTSYTAVNGAASKFSSNLDKGLALGVLGFYVSLGRAMSTLFIGPLWEQYSLTTSLTAISMFIIFILILYWLLIYKRESISNKNEIMN